MKFRVERDVFAEAVTGAARVLPGRAVTSLQVLSGLLLDVADGTVRVSAYDYEVAVRADVEATVTAAGRGLVVGRLLADITRSLPNAPVEVEVQGTRLAVACGNARFALPMLPLEDYPTLPALPEITGQVEGSVFGAAVAQVAVAAGRDDTLPVLTGVRVEIDGEMLTLVATDRYRLAARALRWRPTSPEAQGAALVPARTLLDTAKALSGAGVEVGIAVGVSPSGQQLAGFTDGGSRQSVTRLLEGTFPPYRKLLPDECPLTVPVEIAPLAAVVRRVMLVAPRTAPIVLRLSAGELVVEAGTSGEAQASETVPVAHDGLALEVAFNPSYLLDALGAVESDRAVFGFASAVDAEVAAGKPVIITGADEDGAPVADYRHLVMPIRRNS